MAVEDIFIAAGLVVASTFLIVLLSTLVHGTFTATRQRARGVKGASVLSPLLDIFKASMKESSSTSFTSTSVRSLVLAAWTVSTVLVMLFIPYGRFSLLDNIFGQYQVIALFGLLMVFPVGLMVMCFMSERKVSVQDLKFLAEDFFSAFITFVIAALSMFVMYYNGFSFTSLPVIDDLVQAQSWSIAFPGMPSVPALFAFINPLAMISVLAIMPGIHDPYGFAEGPVSVKWTPFHDFSGKSLALVRIIVALRFFSLLALFIDMFLGGMAFSGHPLLDTGLFVAAAFGIAGLLSLAKARKARWILSMKLGGFLSIHNIIALVALVTSVVLVLA